VTPAYLTDGVRLYEVASQRSDENFGLLRGTLTRTTLRDCADEDQVWTVDDLTLAALSEVRRAA
jgi:hypothetical protein